MVDLGAILSFYRAITAFALSGALPDEAEMMAQRERETVHHHFLTPQERHDLTGVSVRDQQLRLRKGALRFRAWETANPDVAALLRRKAEQHVVQGASCA